ncbi:MAG: hypothetical protein WCP59_15085 [Actinomycetota bacterium]
MSNLGDYQKMTTVAKKVGGPKELTTIVLTVGFVGGLAVRTLSSTVGPKVKSKLGRKLKRSVRTKGAPVAFGQVFVVTSDGGEGGAVLHVGDRYQVLEYDGDAILIAVVGDPLSPYFVSRAFLCSVSDFPHGGNGANP